MREDSVSAQSRGRLRLCCYTSNRSIVGSIITNYRRLVDLLNSDLLGRAFEMEGAIVCESSSADDPGESLELVTVSIAAVNFAVPLDDAPEPPGPLEWVRKRPERIRMEIGQYHIVGEIHLPEGARVRNLLATAVPRFVVLTNAMVRRIGLTGVGQQYEAVVVNRERVALLAAGSSEEGGPAGRQNSGPESWL